MVPRLWGCWAGGFVSFSGETLTAPVHSAPGHCGPSLPWTWVPPSRAVFWQERPTPALRADAVMSGGDTGQEEMGGRRQGREGRRGGRGREEGPAHTPQAAAAPAHLANNK